MRDKIENIIKEKHLERSNCFECSKMTYSAIIKKIEQKFVFHGGDIHWSNMGRFQPNLNCHVKRKIYQKI